MQTFLPYPNFVQSAKSLDRLRLGCQRKEVLQLLNVLHNPNTKGWVNHPATRMWRGYEQALVSYGLTICEEWLSRGYKDTCYAKIGAYQSGAVILPTWLGGRIHKTHRSALLFKAPEWYSQFGWNDTPVYDYYWPV